ncbi:MAG: CYTH domain-containing protein [Paludibacteraceae bacterium]|jgi:CYTH domain-containing protein|nr:CYTH domain-containing protein [Paludibacteraceae bacterium]
MEIERKYLVTNNSYQEMAVARYHIIQGYISREKTGTVRIRITDDKAFLTIKGKPAAGHFARYEWEKEIDVTEATELLQLCQGTIIDKTRWIVPAAEEGLKWEVDEFHGKHDGLVVAEIELLHEDQVVELPCFVGKEVTDDPRYYNANM